MRPRCLAHSPYGPPRPVDKLRFVVVDKQMMSVSAIWTVFPHHNAKRPDIFVSATGLNGSMKFSFHRDILNLSWLAEAHDRLIEEGIAIPGTRHQQQIPIPELPWHGLTVRFVDSLLRKEGKSLEGVDRDIVGVPAPPAGAVLHMGFFLARDSLNVRGGQFCIGEVGTGGRTLAVVAKYEAQDTAKEKHELRAKLQSIVVPSHVDQKVSGSDELAMHMFGEENGTIVVTEAHNIKFVKSQS